MPKHPPFPSPARVTGYAFLENRCFVEIQPAPLAPFTSPKQFRSVTQFIPCLRLRSHGLIALRLHQSKWIYKRGYRMIHDSEKPMPAGWNRRLFRGISGSMAVPGRTL